MNPCYREIEGKRSEGTQALLGHILAKLGEGVRVLDVEAVLLVKHVDCFVVPVYSIISFIYGIGRGRLDTHTRLQLLSILITLVRLDGLFARRLTALVLGHG